MKKVFMLMLCSLFIGCGDSIVHIPKTPDHGDRLDEIEFRLWALEVVTRELEDGVAANKQEIIDKTNLFTQELNDLKDALETKASKSSVLALTNRVRFLGRMLRSQNQRFETLIDELDVQLNVLEGRVLALEQSEPVNIDIDVTFPFLFPIVNLTIQNNNTYTADLTDVLNRLEALEGKASNQEANITDLKGELDVALRRIGSLESQMFQSVEFIELCASSGEFGIEQGGSIYAVGMSYDGGTSLVKLTNGTYYTTSNLTSACRFSLSEDGLKTLDNGHDIRDLFPHLNGNNSGGVIPIQGELRLNMGSPSANSNSYSVKMTVTNLSNYTVGAFKITFTVPSDVVSVSCSGSVNTPILARTGNVVTLTPSSDHTFWILSPQEESGTLTCQVGRTHQNDPNEYQDPKFTNYSAEVL